MIKRRQFIKAILFGTPLLMNVNCRYFDSVLHASTSQVTEFFIVAIGSYGRRVLRQFNHQRYTQPITHPCRNLSTCNQANTRQGFIEISSPTVLPDLSGLQCACYLLDPAEPNAIAWATSTHQYIKSRFKSCSIVVTPHSLPLADNPFGLVCEVCGNDSAAASVLLTLYSCFYNCADIGNMVCFKLHLTDLRDENIKNTRVSVWQGCMDENIDAVVDGLRTGCGNSMAYVIREIPSAIESNQAMDMFFPFFDRMCDNGILSLMNPTLSTNLQRLTVFYANG